MALDFVEQVVKKASNPKSPLHNCFTWEDAEAAHKWRQLQAHELIQGVKVAVVFAEERDRKFF